MRRESCGRSPRWRRNVRCLCGLMVLTLFPGCRGGPVDPTPPTGDTFGPVTMRVYPLTHLDRLADGTPAIICHVEMTDAWGDTVKSTGQLTIQLFGPVGQGGSAVDRFRWDVNLEDLRTNAALFDRATRTYRIVLIGLPEAVVESMHREEDRNPVQFVLRATLTRGAGERQTLTHDFVLQP